MDGLPQHYPPPGISDVRQIKNLVESGIDSKEFTDGVSGVLLEMQIPKELALLMIESKVVAGAVASDGVEYFCGFPELWHVKGLAGEGQELGEGALTGRASRGTIPTNIPIL